MTKILENARPELAYIPLDQLYIPVKYQRTLDGRISAKNIERIRSKFNWGLFGTLQVCKLHSDAAKYAIIDGQHRFKGVELRGGIEEVPCSIISPRDVKEQAEIFLNINSHRLALSPLQFYRASLVQGDPVALAIEAVSERIGVTIPVYASLSHQNAPDVFQAAGYMMQLLRKGTFNADHLGWAFQVVRNGYPNTKGALRFALVRALMEWHKQQPGTKAEDMAKLLSVTPLHSLESAARNMCSADSRTLWRAYFETLGRLHASFFKKAA